VRFRNDRRVMRLIDLLRIDVDPDDFAHPRQKAGQFFAAQFITGAPDNDMPVLTDIKMGIAKTPDVEAFGFVGAGLRAPFRLDDLRSVCKTQVRKIR